MGEYAPGFSFKQCCDMDRERIIHALAGGLVVGEDEGGFEYQCAPKEECDAFILAAWDNLVYQARQLAACGVILDDYIKEKGVKPMRVMEFGAKLMEEMARWE